MFAVYGTVGVMHTSVPDRRFRYGMWDAPEIRKAAL
jgi:hypothetical protein